MWSDDSSFQHRLNTTSLEGVVDNLSNQGTYGTKVRVHQGCKKRVQGASGWFNFFDYVLNLSTSLSEKQQRVWGVPGCKLAVKKGRAEELDRRELMVSTFSPEKVIKLLHLSFVTSK